MSTLSNFEKQYKKEGKLEAVLPPADMWQRIESSLDAKKKSKFAIYYWVAPIAASIALIIAFTFLQKNDLPEYKDRVAIVDKDNSTVNDDNINNVEKKSWNKNDLSSKKQTSTLEAEDFSIENAKIVNLSVPVNESQSKENIRENEILLISHIPTIKKSEIIVDKIPLKKPLNNNWIESFSVSNNFAEISHAKKTIGTPEFKIGGSLSPMYSFRQTNSNNPAIQNQPNAEEGIVDLAFAIDLNMKLSKNWSVVSGVRYSKMGQDVQTGIYYENMFFMASSSSGKTPPQMTKVSLSNSMGNVNNKVKSNNPNEIFNTMDIDKTMALIGFEDNNSDMKGNLKQQLEYIEIPITLRYKIPIESIVEISIAGGISSNWLVNNNSSLTLNNETKSMGEVSNLSTNTFSSHAGLALSVPVVKQLHFKVEPRVNYFLSDINNDYPIGYRPYSFGFFSGLLYNFGN